MTQVNTIDPGTGGDDIIDGGAGTDVIMGGAGNDQITAPLGGKIILGDNGVADLAGPDRDVYSTDPDIGGVDTIVGGADGVGNVIIGGAMGDQLSGGSGDDVMLGDSGYVQRAADGSLIKVYTIDPGVGGADNIQGGAGTDVIMGGADGDIINAPLGGKIILGDNGVADLAGSDRDVYSTDPDIGGVDIITGGADGVGNIIIGGAMGDQLSGGSGDDVMLGDSGYVQRAADGSLIEVYTIDPGVGGVDHIEGGAGTDVIMGGADGDFINAPLGGKIILGDNGVADLAGPDRNVYSTDPDIGGADTIVGGADGVGNIIIGGAMGDLISGGSGDDVIVGDSGFVQRGADASLIRVYTIAPDVGGVDHIDGGAGFDVILGGAAGDFITTTAGGKIILGDNGQVNMIGSDTDVFTTDPSIGGSDTITVGSGTSIILGGADGDIINGGSDEDIIFGDNGHVYRDSNRVVQRVETTDPSIGGSDLIYGNGGNDIILGGALGDEIHAGEGNDIVFGDNGFIDYTAGAPRLIQVSDPTIGGNDWIEGNGGSDIVIGGTGADLLSGDSGTADSSGASDARDVVFGDHAMVDLSLPAGANFFSIFTGSADGGGNDVMYGNGGDDLMMGGQGDDAMYGGDGNDDMIGGHNVPFGSDGNDTMSGGAGADVMIGDNGNIIRSIDPATGDWVRNPAPFNDPVRQVVLYDILDGVGGNDVMSGNDGNDILYGQSGNDLMSGGAGDDEMYGGLGDDAMSGDAGSDVMLGGLGQIIRAFNPDGTAKLNPDGSWHKDVLLTDVSYIVGSIPMSGPNVPCGDLGTVNALLGADVTLLAGVYNADGSKALVNHCDWNTQAIQLDLVSDGNDTIGGGDGNDAIYGQRGDDTLSGDGGDDFIAGGTGNDAIDGGDGNDTLVGDDAFIDTSAPAMPNVTHGFLVVHRGDSAEAALGLDLGMLGTTIVPMAPVAPGREVNAASFVLPQIFGNESAVPADNSLRTASGGRVVAYASVISDFGHHLNLLHGDDSISGGAGNDTLVGDDMVVIAPVVTFTGANMARAEAITRSLLEVSDGFSDLVHRQFSLLGCDWGHDADCPIIDNVYSIGEDTLDGGSGNDVLIGDNSTMIAPTFTVPANLAEKFENFQNGAADAGDQMVDTVLDLVHLEHGLRDTTIQVTIGRHTYTEVQHHVDLIMMGNDSIDGGDGNDFIVGDAFAVRAPTVIVTQPEPGVCWDDRHHERDWRDDEGWYSHGGRADWWQREGWSDHDQHQLDAIQVDSDTINGGAGDDLIYGDSAAMISSTIVRAHGVSSRDFGNALNEVGDGLSRLMAVSGGTDLWVEFSKHDHDHGHDHYGWAHDSDRDREQAHHHDNDDGDVIFGGDGNDILFGQDGRDQLHGDAGDDWLIGGSGPCNDHDLLDGGGGRDKLYPGSNNSRQLRDLVEDAVPTIDLSGSSGSFFGAPAQDQDDKGCAPWLDDFLNNLGRDDSQNNPNAGIRVQIDADFQVLPTAGKR
ncbi:MAG: calcium-binding protein [Burkholderiales bacterium]